MQAEFSSLRCLDCNIDTTPRGEPGKWQLCRKCWRARGSPWKAVFYMCTGQDCSNKSFLTKGPAFARRVCQACYNRLRHETLRTIYKGRDPPGWSEGWEGNTVFLGNLPYDATDEEVEAWVQQRVFPDRDPYPPLFRIRGENGGRQGDHGVQKKNSRDSHSWNLRLPEMPNTCWKCLTWTSLTRTSLTTHSDPADQQFVHVAGNAMRHVNMES